MYIENRHKNTDLYGGFTEGIITIIKVLDIQYFAISGDQYRIILDVLFAVGVPEKRDDKDGYYSEKNGCIRKSCVYEQEGADNTDNDKGNTLPGNRHPIMYAFIFFLR
jgi:hypothetical protein